MSGMKWKAKWAAVQMERGFKRPLCPQCRGMGVYGRKTSGTGWFGGAGTMNLWSCPCSGESKLKKEDVSRDADPYVMRIMVDGMGPEHRGYNK